MDFKKMTLTKLLSAVFLVVALLVSASCVPEQKASTKRTSSNNGTVDDGDDTGAGDPTYANDKFYWYVDGQTVEATARINESTQSVMYLGSKSINAFLKADGRDLLTYCFVGSFFISDSSAKHTLRARAIPISFTNFTTRTIERRFRIDIADEATNQATCGGNVLRIDANGNTTTNLDANTAFVPTKLCTNCTGILNSTNISLYVKNNTTLVPGDRISNTFLELESLGLRIDTSNSSTDPVASCTNTDCQARGFNCCLAGQCVKDGALRPNAILEDNYQQAITDVALNPSHFINYPNVYFVCGSGSIPTPTPTPIPDPTATANAAFEKLKKEYYCLEQAPNGDYNSCDPNADEASFLAIRENVWTRCGCTLPAPIDPDDPRCPDFGLKAEFNAAGAITAVTCKIPDPVVDPTPFQNLSLPVSSRSAPHRFYSTDGTNIDNLETVKNQVPKVLVEGDEFMYLDPAGKSEPVGVNLNMNAILGQMKVELNSAVPAKMVGVEFDQTYIISAVSGYYTPCPQCTNDSWFESFKAHPATSGGSGLRAVGYSTARDEYSNNTTYGNYEDTVFGRACYLPPTMIPLSHKPFGDVNAQRRNRLKTQAAYFMNGYQKDWFGFNKGAIIGSFDGVTWFAIGSGRRVTATSNKLFIAVNNPYADLADRTDFIINIVTDLGNNVVSNIDYDPELSPNHPEQNTGATCQYFHQCNVDSDCIAKLGWEYACADTSYYKTPLPKFNINATEQANQQISNATFDLILQGFFPSGSAKRCVYRGAGAPCKKNPTAGLKIDNRDTQKLFTCAPNFYCASADEAAFNTEIARTPNHLDIFLFGKETNVLGRPLHYIGAQGTLPQEVRENMASAALDMLTDSSDFGICRPGKNIASANPIQQHQTPDSLQRTDFISQVGSCQSASLSGANRVIGCPAIETRDDQATPKGDILWSANTLLRHNQNMCGGESRRSPANDSTFKNIEAQPLNLLFSIMTPTIAADACLRRAGSVCHTDLDCGPNKFHAEQADFLGTAYFGGTDAEQKYWQEYLVCGQAQAKPFLNSDKYYEYDMTKNRCCREIGKDFTMYTQGPSTIVTGNGTTNPNLDTERIPFAGTNATGRYSRYSVVDVGDATLPQTEPYFQKPMVATNTTPKQYQWKTIHDTGEKNCCGGGWIRKFADGNNNWAQAGRLNMNLDSFSCLNYANTMHVQRPAEVPNRNYISDSNRLCLSPIEGGCVQSRPITYNRDVLYTGGKGSLNAGISVPGASTVLQLDSNISWGGFEVDNFEIRPPVDPGVQSWFLDTSPLENPKDTGILVQGKSIYAPYMPVPYKVVNPNSDDGPFTFFADPLLHYGVSFYMPIYIGATLGSPLTNIEAVYIKYFQNNRLIAVREAQINSPSGICPGIDGNGVPTWPYPGAPVGAPVDQLAEEYWCIAYDTANAATRREVFHIVSQDDLGGGQTWDYAGVVIKFRPMGTPSYNLAGGGVRGVATSGMMPGNALYYLTKLARLELLGIPQIPHEPLYCNTDRSQLMSGIYNTGITNRSQFDAQSFIYNSGTNNRPLSQIYDANNSNADVSNPNNRVVFQDKIELNKVFSDNEFKCCHKLGTVTPSSDRCCSGYSAVVNNERICQLPSKTNLNVYFNKFVSGEGSGDHLSVDPLLDADFIPETGEPRLTQEVNNKILALGQAYCASGTVRKGGLFGYFFPEPNNGYYNQDGDVEDSRYFGAADSTADYDPDNDTGTVRFLEGYRWDHHFYCQ